MTVSLAITGAGTNVPDPEGRSPDRLQDKLPVVKIVPDVD
jgi:hypothetical protein